MTAAALVELHADALQSGDVIVDTFGGGLLWERTVDSVVSDCASVWVDFTDESHARFAAGATVWVRRP